MLDVCLLGTGGMMPLPRRRLTSLMARYNGKNILIDCGEGTQVGIREKGWTIKPLDVICFTHFHADHISGLPGLLLTLGNAERTEPLLMIGPRGLERVVNSLRVIAPELPFEIEFLELTENRQIIERDGYKIDAFKVNHKVTCYGYSIIIDRAGRFDAARAKELNIPLKCWNPLQKGETVTMDGQTYTPDLVMGPPRKGIKVTYCTDTRPEPVIADAAEKADLFICEGMYGEEDRDDKARQYKHMTCLEAAKLALAADPKEMWLTHFSPLLTKPWEYEDALKKVFERTVIPKDLRSITIDFEED